MSDENDHSGNMKPIVSETLWLATIWFFTCHKYSMGVNYPCIGSWFTYVLDNFLYLFFYLAFKLRGAKYSYIVEKTKASSRPSHYFYIIKKTYILLISRPYSPHFLHRATRSWLKYIKAYKNIDDIPLKHGQYWSCVEFIYQHQSSHLTVSFSC